MTAVSALDGCGVEMQGARVRDETRVPEILRGVEQAELGTGVRRLRPSVVTSARRTERLRCTFKKAPSTGLQVLCNMATSMPGRSFLILRPSTAKAGMRRRDAQASHPSSMVRGER